MQYAFINILYAKLTKKPRIWKIIPKCRVVFKLRGKVYLSAQMIFLHYVSSIREEYNMKNKKRGMQRNTRGKKLLCVMLSALMFFTMFAGDWNLADGDIFINASEAGQTVTQGTNAPVADSAPVISSSAETSNKVTISGSGDATAQVAIQDAVITTSGTESAITVTAGSNAEITIKNVDISTDGNANAIDIAENSDAAIVVDGANNIDTGERTSGYGDSALIHVGSGAALTIQGDGEGQNDLRVYGNHTHGAGIGSNAGEDFTGEISFRDDVYVHSGVTEYGAAVGSGNGGDFSGVVNVDDGAELYAETGRNNAAIGAGQNGDFTENAEVNISNSTVRADTYNNGAAIGGGYKGDFAGTVTITNSEVTAVAGHIEPGAPKGEGAAIGAGYSGDFSGKVSIIDSTLTAVAFNDGAAIGAGGVDDKSPDPAEFTEDGVVNIHNSNVTLETHDRGIPIGAPEVVVEQDGKSYYSNGIYNGTINITGSSNVTLIDARNTELGAEALIGGAEGNGTVTIDDTTQISYWTGERDLDNYSECTENYKFDQSYRGATKDGELAQADEAALKEIVKGARFVINVVPKPNDPDNNGGSTTVCVSTVYDFWRSLEAKIRSCQPGDEIIVNVADATEMPCYILEALTECGVNLTIEWNGGEDIEIKHDHGIEYEHEEIEFTVLIDLLNNQ